MSLFSGSSLLREKKEKGAKMVEDSLLEQIDAFRKRAEKLQSLIDDKKNRVAELEENVKKTEEKSLLLQSELDKKQKAAESVLADIKVQFDELNDKIDDKLSCMENNISDIFKDVSEDSESLDNVKEELSTKIHSENVRMYRNIQDFLKSQGSIDELEVSLIKRIRSNTTMIKVSIAFGVIDFGMLAVVLLKLFGMI